MLVIFLDCWLEIFADFLSETLGNRKPLVRSSSEISMPFRYLCVIYAVEKLTTSPDFFLAHNIPHIPQSRNCKEKKYQLFRHLRSLKKILLCCCSGDHSSRLGNGYSCSQHFYHKPYVSGSYNSTINTLIREEETGMRSQTEDDYS